MPYLIDGNNLLGSWGGPRGPDDRRGEVVRRVAAFCRARGAKATLVFDGHPLRPDMAAQDLGPLSLRVPPPGEDADTVIRELLDRAPRAADYVVVTSDKALYSYAKTMGPKCSAPTSGTRSSGGCRPRRRKRDRRSPSARTTWKDGCGGSAGNEHAVGDAPTRMRFFRWRRRWRCRAAGTIVVWLTARQGALSRVDR